MNLVPFVHTSHVLPSKATDFGTTDTIPLLKNSISEYAIHSVLSNFFQNCDALIALNQPAYQSIREFGFTGPVFVVPNGRDLAHYNQCQFPASDADQKVLIFIGFMNDRKNQHYLLKVLRSLPENYVLRLIGKPLSDEYEEKLTKFIKKNKLSNVEFIGQVEHSEIPRYLEEAHVFSSASKMEVQSLVVIEALASGTPIVGLSNETIDELIDDQVGAWLSKDQKPAEFARQIQRICNLDEEDYQTMCQEARNRVVHLDWTNIVDSTVEAYQEILKTKPTITIDESDMLTSLVTFLSMGDVREYLLDRIEETRKRSSVEANILPKIKVPESIRSLIRVPSSTWLISGVTIVISVIGYLFMRGRGNKE
jgi:glycosyltransferase involved in cell wall biosynthesis